MTLSTNWKIALALDAAAGFAGYVLWSRGVIGGYGLGCIIFACAAVSALLTHATND